MPNDKAGKGLNLWQKATVFLSVMSWFTTEKGFQNTVFVGENPAWSMFASFAIQTILLAGVLFGPYILKQFEGSRKAICISIWGMAAVVSIMFSYISISNSMYYVDFAVDGNQITEKFMRTTVQDIEQNNLKKLEEIRPQLIENLNKNGYDVMSTDIQTRASNYVNVTADFKQPEKKEYLAEIDQSYLTAEERKEFGRDKRMNVTGDYAKKAYPETYKTKTSNPESWKMIVAQTINSLNHEGYEQYDDLYQQETEIVERYNELRGKMSGEPEQFPTLDQMQAVQDSCERLIINIDKTDSAIEDYRVKDKPRSNPKPNESKTYTVNTANQYVDKARTIIKALKVSVQDLQNAVKEIIEHSYGLDSKSVDEIIALIGNSNAEVEELKKARTQMLEAQGSILQSKGKELQSSFVTEINTLMSMLNNYVDLAVYHQEIAVFKDECLSCTYNIVKEEEDIQEHKTTNIATKGSATGQAVSMAAASGTAVDGSKPMTQVIDVTPGLWTTNRKVHMSKLNALIYNYPMLNANGNQNDIGDDYKETLDDYGTQVHQYEKTFLDTSESEKADGFLIGKKDFFPHKGKAWLALFFAIFLDLGAAAVGVMIYLVKEKIKTP